MRLGVFIPTGNNGWIPSTTSPQIRPSYRLNHDLVRRAEANGFDFALCMVKWRGFGGETGFWNYSLETTTLMAALAATTSRINLYCSIAVLTIHPAVLARMAATINDIAPGRFGINIVSGWNRDEYSQMGLWPSDDYFQERYDYASEYVAVMRELWEDGRSSFKGRYFQLEDCELGLDAGPPIAVVAAGSSERGLRFAAEYADFNFNSALGGADAVRATNAALLDAAAIAGRKVKPLILRQVILDETDDLARARFRLYNEGTDIVAARNMQSSFATDSSGTSSRAAAKTMETYAAVHDIGHVIIGSPRTVATRINEIASVETTDGLVMSFDDYEAGFDHFCKEVIPLLDFQVGAVP